MRPQPRFANLDANESIFFARQLEHIMAETYDVDFEANRVREFVPVSHRAGPGAQSITWYAYTRWNRQVGR